MAIYKQQEAICRELGDPNRLATSLINAAFMLGLSCLAHGRRCLCRRRPSELPRHTV